MAQPKPAAAAATVPDTKVTPAPAAAKPAAPVVAKKDPLEEPNFIALRAKRNVFFEYNKYEVQLDYFAPIEVHSKYLKAKADSKILIQGNADERGSSEYNLALGQKRAEAVRRALGLLGVADRQVEAVSFGKEKPAVQGTDEAAFAKNRRTEISYR